MVAHVQDTFRGPRDPKEKSHDYLEGVCALVLCEKQDTDDDDTGLLQSTNSARRAKRNQRKLNKDRPTLFVAGLLILPLLQGVPRDDDRSQEAPQVRKGLDVDSFKLR